MALGLASNASAQSGFYPGWYVGIGAGPTIMQDPSGSFTTSSRNVVGSSFKAKMDPGFAVSLSAGYEGLFIPEFRVEGEINYHSNQIKSVSGPFFGGSLGATGSFDAIGLMVNGYYDFLTGSPWTPYLGGGVGAGHVAVSDAGIPAAGTGTFSDSDWKFAYQGIAGVRYGVTPTLSLSLDYRYFSTLDPKFTFSTPIGAVSAKSEYHTHNIMLGLAYHFVPPPPPPPVAAAPPPPPAPAPPPPARQFVVYFEFDKSDLTPEGAKVVQDAVAAYKQTGSARIAVTGYTDLAGTQRYNLALSKRRADTVRAALVRQGVPDSAIAEAWRGKENPAVPTPDGVREPRNRRVEIVL